MSIEKYKDDLDSLLEIAKNQNGRINLSMILFTCKCDADDMPDIMDFFYGNDIEVLSDDVEIEGEETVSDPDMKPFDPSKIDINMDKITIDSIIKRIRNNEIEMDSSFQRKKGLWNINKKAS